MDERTRLGDFFDYAFPNASRRTVRYGLFAPGTYKYVVRPSARSLCWLANRVNGDAYRRRAAASSFKTLAAVAPRAFPYLPTVSRDSFDVPVDVNIDIAIFGMRAKLLDFDGERVYTLPLDVASADKDVAITSEATVRHRLPDDINAPAVYKLDADYPYLVEEFVPGDSLSDPVNDWPAIREGLRQLKSLYSTTTESFVPTEIMLENALDAFDTAGLADDPTVKRARRFVAGCALPDELRRCRVHGDYQTGNLLVRDGETYILDWEFSCVDLCLVDCFTAFKRKSIESKDGGPLSALVERRGPYREIGDDIAETIGPLAYSDDSYYEVLPILYLLHQFANLPDHVVSRDHFAYTLLRDVLDDVA